jgi:hypothetical protein
VVPTGGGREVAARPLSGYIRAPMEPSPGFFQRLVLAFVAFFYVLVNAGFASRVRALRDAEREGLPPPPAGPAPEPRPAAAAAPAPAPAPAARQEVAMAPARPHGAEALQLLALLQRDGRLVDFVSEDLSGFSDAEIGAAARTVHAGCRKVVDAYLKLEPVYRDGEGASVTVAPGFDPAAVRLTGNVVGDPPFRGTLRHHGWRAADVRFPELPGDGRIVAPAEVEL